MRGSEIVGRPVILREGGREAGKVKDVIVDQPGKKVLGFVISEGLLRSTRVVPWDQVQVIGPDAVILAGESSVVAAGEAPAIKEVLEGGGSIRGLKVQTTGGKELGRIDDFVFNEQTGEVEGYELSGGRLTDTFGGRSHLPVPETIELGKDVAFVDPAVEETIEHLSGGIKGVFSKSED